MSVMSTSKATNEMGLLAHEKAPRPPPTFSTGNYRINWVNTAIIMLPPLLVSASFLTGVVPVQTKTMWVMFIFILLAGFGITAGYHRMWSHRAYSGKPALQWFLAFIGAGAFEGSIKWWCRNHRIHHRYIDTDKDPYNALRGFWFTHVGWMLMKQDYEILGRVDMSDLNANRIVRSQHNYYLPIALLSGVILPTLICGLGWGDWYGGYVYAALCKMMIVHHGTFSINSLAHTNMFGATKNYSDEHSSHDSWVCAIITLGEGYHNFHHEFAQDYRNGVQWYHIDPTKWLIRLWEVMGLAYGLVRTPNDVIARNYCHMHHQKHLKIANEFAARIEKLEQQTSIPSTETWSWKEVEERVARGEKLMVIGNYVIDLQKKVATGNGYTHASKSIVWYDAHPGGRKILDMFIGKDATEGFTGGIYKHSRGATNLLKHLRVAQIQKDYTMQEM